YISPPQKDGRRVQQSDEHAHRLPVRLSFLDCLARELGGAVCCAGQPESARQNYERAAPMSEAEPVDLQCPMRRSFLEAFLRVASSVRQIAGEVIRTPEHPLRHDDTGGRPYATGNLDTSPTHLDRLTEMTHLAHHDMLSGEQPDFAFV